MVCPFRHREVPAQELINMSTKEVSEIPKKITEELGRFER